MTHTLHRRGTADNLSRDYTMLTMPAAGINDQGHEEKMKEFLRIALRHNPKNIGTVDKNMHSHSAEEVVNTARKVAHAVFDNPEDVTEVLKDLKAADMGMSVVVGGILDSVNECCEKAGLKRHTVEFSLGIWGNTAKLPADEVLQVTTMCGHAMVSPGRVQQMVEEVRKGGKTPEDAGKELAEPCCCGVFNPARAAELLASMAGVKTGS